jgi:hypothetical protein
MTDPKVIADLFGVIGTVTRVLVMTNHYKAFVEFEDKICAGNAREFFGGLALFDTVLDLTFSKHKAIDLRKGGSNKTAKKFNKIFVNSSNKEQYFQHEQRLSLKNVRIECELHQAH